MKIEIKNKKFKILIWIKKFKNKNYKNNKKKKFIQIKNYLLW